GLDLGLQAPTRFSHDGPATGTWGGEATRAYSSEAPSGILRFVSGNLEIDLAASTYRRTLPFSNQDFSRVTYFDDPLAYDLDRPAWADVKYRATLSPVVQLSTRLYGDTFDYQRYSDSSFSPRCFYQGALACRLHTLGASHWEGGELQASFDWLHDARLVT